jgi:ParB family chromosome partitioning protein
MMERGKMTQSEVAQAVSKGRTTITNALRLLELPEEAQQLLYEERITAGHARAILSIPTKEGRQKLTEKLVNEQLSVREAENLARLISGKKKKEVESRVAVPKSYKTVARALSDSLDTAVKIKSVKGGNKIEITFKDEADLQRLFRLITSS